LAKVVGLVDMQCIVISFDVWLGLSQWLLFHCEPNALSNALHDGMIGKCYYDVT